MVNYILVFVYSRVKNMISYFDVAFNRPKDRHAFVVSRRDQLGFGGSLAPVGRATRAQCTGDVFGWGTLGVNRWEKMEYYRKSKDVYNMKIIEVNGHFSNPILTWNQ